MLVGQSAMMGELREQIAKIARTNFTVLIEGESGAGKEIVARQLHVQSPRGRIGPYVAVNCAAIVESLLEAELFGIEERTATGVRGRRGKFEMAHRGTLFLDEVGDLSVAAQAKLLRVLQDGIVERVGAAAPVKVDTRVIAATNRCLHQMVATNRFRPDLYYRLAGMDITVPPLRHHRQDIPELVRHFLTIHGYQRLGVSADASAALESYDWPGNVRQLGRVIERAIALTSGTEIALADLPDTIASGRGPQPKGPIVEDDTLRAWSSRHVRSVLERCKGNKRRACEVLDITYRTLQSLLDYGTDLPDMPSETASALGVTAMNTPPN